MLATIRYYEVFGITLITYLGIFAFLSLSATVLIATRKKKGSRLAFKWHHHTAVITIILVAIHGIFGLLIGDTIGYGMAGSNQSEETRVSSSIATGHDIFNSYCKVCHINGGNIINPNKPMKDSKKLADFETFLSYVRHPTVPMPSFSQVQISDAEAKELYRYLVSEEGLNLTETK
jgi:cytochrome c6